jgi:hypothetical protein
MAEAARDSSAAESRRAMEGKSAFGTRGLDLLEDLKKSFESQGHACTVEVETFKGFELHTPTVTRAERAPVKFTPAREL